MSQFFRTKLGYASLVLCITALGLISSKSAYEYLHFKQNVAYLQNLSDRLLNRAELAADYAIIAISDAEFAGHNSCTPSALMPLREKIYARGNLKDFAILDVYQNVQCTVLDASSIIPRVISQNDQFGLKHNDIRFVNFGAELNSVFGIIWQFDNYGIMAVTNIDMLLFDIFPPGIRDYSIAKIGFDHSNLIGKRDSLMASSMAEEDLITVNSYSDRFPLNVELSVDCDQLIAFDRTNELPTLIGGTLASLIFGLLLAQLLSRPIDPVSEIKQGISNDEFIPFVQPLFDLKTRKIVGGEALVRWQKPDGSIISPARFIDLAEDNNLTKSMTRSLVRQTLFQLGSVMAGDRALKIAFNVTPRDLVSENFATDLIQIVTKSHVQPSQVVLEITERQEITNTDEMNEMIDQLKEHGFRIALDDTGTGHNGLSYVQDLNADILKIDKKFVDFVAEKDGDHIVRLLVQLAQRMKMQTVAEGIECEQQAQILQRMGIDHGQGFLVSKPLPIEDYCAAIKGQNTNSLSQVA